MLCKASESSERKRKHFWKHLWSTLKGILVARCWPATKRLMTPAISLCLWTLIKGSRIKSRGRGCKLKKTSGYAGGLSVPVSPSMSTGSDGAVGSIKSGSLSNSYSWERYTPGTDLSVRNMFGYITYLRMVHNKEVRREFRNSSTLMMHQLHWLPLMH